MTDAPAETRFRLGYRPSLDGLRAVAMSLVVLHHDRRLPGGFLGVDLFFVLSGLLITCILREEWEATGSIRLGRFYGRRLLRLGPALLAFLLVSYLVTHFVEPQFAPMLRDRWALGALFYVTDLLAGLGREYPLGLVSIHWSLAIEEQFYLLWPLCLRALVRSKLAYERIAVLLCAGSLLPLLLRQLLILRQPGDATLWLRLYFAPDTRADALLIGCALGLLLAGRPPGRRPRLGLAAAALGMAILLPCWARLDIVDVTRRAYRPSLTALASAAILYGVLEGGRLARILAWAPLVWLGRLSYSLYLWHVVGLEIARGAGPIGKLAAMLALASASHYLVERPFLGLKARLSHGAFAADPARAPRARSRAALLRLPAGLLALLLVMGAGYTRRARSHGADLVAEARDRLQAGRDDPGRLLDLGEALSEAGQAAEAVLVLQEAAARRPDARTLSALGHALRKSGRPADADARFRQALRVAPGYAGAELGLGELALDHDQLAEAMARYERALAGDPTSAAAHNALGIALALSGDLDRAVEQFKEAARLSPDPETLANLARAQADRRLRGGRVP